MKYLTIHSLQNSLIKHLCKLKLDKKYRDKSQSVIIEGTTLIKELAPFVEIKGVYTLHEHLIPSNIHIDNFYLIDKKIADKISSTINSEGIFAEIIIPKKIDLSGKHFILVLDQIQDPGNLGTLFRSALSLGWEGVFLINGCCDPYNDKAIRAAKGATFKLPHTRGSYEELLNLIEKEAFFPLAADLTGQLPSEISEKNKLMLILGNEGQGLSKTISQNCQKVTIPMNEKMESLNVAIAGSILMYALRSSYP